MSPLQEGCTSTFPPDASDTPAGCTIPPSCTTQGCVPVACIPQACLAPGVTQASLAGYTKFSQVPAADLIPPEQAEYNVLNVYFNGTPVASSFGATPGSAAPLNYLQIYSPDIQYAQTNVNAPAQVVETSGTTVSTTAQDLLNLASQKLLEIAEPPAFFTGEVSLGSGVYYLQFPNGTVFGYYNFPSFPDPVPLRPGVRIFHRCHGWERGTLTSTTLPAGIGSTPVRRCSPTFTISR